MKRVISILLVLVLCMGLCACNQKPKYEGCVSAANKHIEEYKANLNTVPYTLSGLFDESMMTYVLTLAAKSEEALSDFAHETYYSKLKNEGLTEMQIRAALVLIVPKLDKFNSSNAVIVALATMGMPLEEFEKYGIKLVVKYRDRNGNVSVIDDEMLREAINSITD